MPETQKNQWRSAVIEGWLVWFRETKTEWGLPSLDIHVVFDDEEQRVKFQSELFTDLDVCPPIDTL
ncbi:MAG: hypothetical protein ACRD2L_13815 [Terriglobia bacterium]